MEVVAKLIAANADINLKNKVRTSLIPLSANCSCVLSNAATIELLGMGERAKVD